MILWHSAFNNLIASIEAGLYRIWCGVHTLGDTSAFVNPAGQLLLIVINNGSIAEWMAAA